MAAMAYSMLPQEVGIGYTSDTLDDTNTIYYVPLSYLEDIVEVMGDGLIADEITSTSDVTYQFRQAGNTRNLAIGKNLPVIKNSLYPSLYFAFIFSGNNMLQAAVQISIINATTGTILNLNNITNINMQITHLDVYSFNNKTKALSGASARDMALSGIVFAENGVLMPKQTDGVSETQYLSYAFPDGTVGETRHYDTFISQSFTTFENAICGTDPSVTFNGIYVEIRGVDRITKYIVVNGITYKIFGQPTQSLQGTSRPKICVSSELIPN